MSRSSSLNLVTPEKNAIADASNTTSIDFYQ